MDHLYVEAGNELPLLETPVAATVRDTWRDVVLLNVTLFAVRPFFYMTRWPWICERLKTGTRAKSLDNTSFWAALSLWTLGTLQWNSPHFANELFVGLQESNGEFPSLRYEGLSSKCIRVAAHEELRCGPLPTRPCLSVTERLVRRRSVFVRFRSAPMVCHYSAGCRHGTHTAAHLVVHANTEERPFCF